MNPDPPRNDSIRAAAAPAAGSDSSSAKRAARAAARARILALDPEARRDEEETLVEVFERAGVPGLADAGVVALYLPAFPEEIPADRMVAAASRAGKRVVLPRVVARERRLALHEADPRDVARGNWARGPLGLREPRSEWPELDPSEVDWLLAPGLAFTPSGDRLGRGGGYYDRLLARLRPDAIAWAFAFEVQIVPELPVEPHDRRVAGIATGAGVRPARARSRPEPA